MALWLKLQKFGKSFYKYFLQDNRRCIKVLDFITKLNLLPLVHKLKVLKIASQNVFPSLWTAVIVSHSDPRVENKLHSSFRHANLEVLMIR